MRLCSRSAWLAGSAGAAAAWVLPPSVRAQSVALTIGAGLIESHAEGYYALEAGFFAQRGLTVEIKQLRNGATIAAAVASGDLQLGCSTVLQLTQARGKGLPFTIVAAGAVHERGSGTVGLVVPAASPVRSAKEMNGKTVAVSTLNGLDQLATSVLVDKSGGDAASLKFVELSPAAMGEALETGRIGGASMEVPELTAELTRGRTLGDGLDQVANRFVTTAWFGMADWLAKNKDAAHRFADAIFAAGAWATANPERAGVVLQKWLKFKESRGSQHFATANDPSETLALARAAIQYKVATAIPPTDLLWDGR